MTGGEFCGAQVAQSAVRTLLVVIASPGGNQNTGLRQAGKPVVVQALVAKAPVEALDESILGRLPGFDQLQRNAVGVRPLIQRLAGEFRPLICPDCCRQSPELGCTLQHLAHVQSADAEISDQIDRLLGEIIDDRQNRDPLAISKRVADNPSSAVNRVSA